MTSSGSRAEPDMRGPEDAYPKDFLSRSRGDIHCSSAHHQPGATHPPVLRLDQRTSAGRMTEPRFSATPGVQRLLPRELLPFLQTFLQTFSQVLTRWVFTCTCKAIRSRLTLDNAPFGWHYAKMWRSTFHNFLYNMIDGGAVAYIASAPASSHASRRYLCAPATAWSFHSIVFDGTRRPGLAPDGTPSPSS